MTAEHATKNGDATTAYNSDASKELRAVFRDHLQIAGLRDAYDHLLATTRLSPKFEEGGDSKAKVVSLQRTDGRALYRLELYRWSLWLSICEPAHEAWRQLSAAPQGHFWPRFVGVDDKRREILDADNKDDDERTLPGLRIISVADVRDIIDFARSTEYPL